MKVSVSIVTYNSANVINTCLKSILDNTYEIDYEIIIVDNASQDKTVSYIESDFPKVRLIKNEVNVGFGRAHNQAFKIARGEYFLILNPDTIIFDNALKKASNFLDNTKDAGLVGCKIWWDDDKKFMFPDLPIHNLKTALLYFTPLSRYFPENPLAKSHRKSAYRVWNATTPIKVDGVTGGFMMVRSGIFKTIGGFDENFFLFFEEHDLQRRIKKLGWKIYYLPDVEIQHLYEESFRNSQIDIGKIYFQSALFHYKKHYGIFGKIFLQLLIKISSFLKTQINYKTIYTKSNNINIEWKQIPHAMKYLLEISYSSDFNDRGGFYIENSPLVINANILKRLPNNTGFIKISPVYKNNIHGKTLAIYKITDRIQ